MAETETSGGGGGGTSWSNVSISTMWAWVNQDLAPFYNQASSWEKTSELCGLYSRRLEAFRERLAQSWNPDTSPASQAFLTKLDDLITSVKDVNTVASNNYQPAKDIASAIAEAKRNLEPYYNQAQVADTPQDYEDAHRNATRVMGTLSGDLSNARTGIGEPRPYVAPAPPGKDSGGGGGDYSGGPAAPFIPPVVPVPPPQSPPMMTSPGPTTPMPAPKGPDLVGLNPPPPGPGPGPMQPMPPGGPPPVGPGPVPPGPVIRPPVIGGPPPVRPTPPIGRPVGPMTPPLTGPGRGQTTGIIGGQQPPTTGRGPGGLRANPVGGMIGSPNTARPGAAGGPAGRGVVGGLGAAGAAGRGPGAAGAAGRGALVGGAAGRGANQHDEDGEHFDPDTAWDVAEGVTPVLEAPENQGPIDPGPAIGLSR